MKRLRAALLLTVMGTALLPGMRIRGFWKSFALVYQLPDSLAQQADNPPLGLVANRLRLSVIAPLSSSIQIEAAWDLSPRYSEGNDEAFFPSPTAGDWGLDYRVADFDSRLAPAAGTSSAGFTLYHNLDRLMITLKLKGADLFIGRQAIAWGSARTINPTDVIAPFTFNELDTENRRGVDALRLRIPMGMMNELDMGWVAGKNFSWSNSALFLRGRFRLWHTDISLLTMAFRRHLLLGVDLARSIGGAGAWLEAAWVRPHTFAEVDPDDRDSPYFRLSTGLDYNFSGGIYIFGEYHFNSAGRNDPGAYAGILDDPAFRDGAVYLMGRHYLSMGATIQATPLLPLSLLVIWNLSDGSLVLAPTAEYNVAENVYLAAGIYLGVGRDPGWGPAGPELRSEFGTWPHMVYTAFRYYF